MQGQLGAMASGSTGRANTEHGDWEHSALYNRIIGFSFNFIGQNTGHYKRVFDALDNGTAPGTCRSPASSAPLAASSRFEIQGMAREERREGCPLTLSTCPCRTFHQKS